MVLKNFDQETTQLVPNKMMMKSKTELTQYYINQWQLTYLDDGKSIPIRVEHSHSSRSNEILDWPAYTITTHLSASKIPPTRRILCISVCQQHHDPSLFMGISDLDPRVDHSETMRL